MRFQRFQLTILPTSAGGFTVRTASPRGEGRSDLVLPFSPEAAASEARTAPRLVGEKLFAALFQGETLSLYERCVDLLTDDAEGTLRLEFQFDPHDTEFTALQSMPWELLCRPGSPEFVALDRRRSIVRYLKVPRSISAAAQPKNLRIVAVAAEPRLRGSRPLDLEGEIRNLRAAVESSGNLKLIELPSATLATLRHTLVEQECHVLHFFGHSGRDQETGKQVLFFEGQDRRAHVVTGADLTNVLTGFPLLRLVVLNACGSGRVPEASEDNAYDRLAVASSLALGGMPAVIAMREPLSDSAAIAFSRVLYRRLAVGESIDLAMVEARQEIHSIDRGGSEWAIPILFTRSATGELFPQRVLPVTSGFRFGSLFGRAKELRASQSLPPGTPRRISASVASAIARLEAKHLGGAVTAWRIVQEVLGLHDEYGGHRAEEIRPLPGPSEVTEKPIVGWMMQVGELFDEARVEVLHGRLLILGLAKLAPELAEYLEAQGGFLSGLRSELQEPFESLLLPQAESEVRAVTPDGEVPLLPPPINDPTPLHLDSPALTDHLGRRGFARALAIRLERIWREMNPRNRPTDRPVPQGSFILHLHGPWGSGKSSILEMLRRELQPKGNVLAPTVSSPWVVVDFNAWQNQRLDPPWWPLLDGIFRQSARQISWWRRMWLRLCEGFWRFSTKRRDLLVFGALFLILGFLGYRFLRPALIEQLAKGLGDMGDAAGHISDIVAVLTLVTSWIWLGSRSLISGSARAAQSFLDSAADPMDRIQRHFQRMVRMVDRPIAVFVDDLDRCQASNVVQLLEGIQTLFRDPRVVYVIAADQRWLHACFEKTYEAFAESVREPGRRLGSLFLEKAFEISVALPGLSPSVRADYWNFLLGGDSAQAEQRLASLEQEARVEFQNDRSEQQVVARLEEGKEPIEVERRRVTLSVDPADSRGGRDVLREQARRQVAVEQLASAAVEKSVSYFLQQFAPLLEPNPRSMKRLLNAYAIRRDLAILSGLDVLAHEGRRKKLALWTILALRWPALEDFLLEKAGGDDSEPGAEVAALLASREVAEVVEGRNLGGPLTLDDLKELLGFGPVGNEKPE